MTWPNDETWMALQTMPQCEISGQRFALSVIDCGELVAPSGRIAICAPFTEIDVTGNPVVCVPSGRYPVRITVADVSEHLDGSRSVIAYASLILLPHKEMIRKGIILEGESALSDGEYYSFAVDDGTACFVDEVALADGMPPVETWYDCLFEKDEDHWFHRMDDPAHIREGVANIPLPFAQGEENVILFRTGWGDGVYPIIGGYDAMGRLVAIHIDFGVIPNSSPAENAA